MGATTVGLLAEPLSQPPSPPSAVPSATKCFSEALSRLANPESAKEFGHGGLDKLSKTMTEFTGDLVQHFFSAFMPPPETLQQLDDKASLSHMFAKPSWGSRVHL